MEMRKEIRVKESWENRKESIRSWEQWKKKKKYNERKKEKLQKLFNFERPW
jgi:hypothetical protein